MNFIYVVMERDEILFITNELITAIEYWQEQRQQVFGKRPDIYEWELGIAGRYNWIKDEEVQDHVNYLNKLKTQRFIYNKGYYRILPIEDLLLVLYKRIEQLGE